MSPGKETIAFINKTVKRLPASNRPDDPGKWFRSILGVILILTGIVILLYQVFSGVKLESWTQMLPPGLPIAAGLFLFDPKHVVDAVKAGRKSS